MRARPRGRFKARARTVDGPNVVACMGSRMASVTVGVVLVGGCFPAPKSDTALAGSGTSGIDLGGSDESPFGSESGGSTGGAQGSSGGGDTTGTATTAALDGTGSSGGGDTGGGWDTDGGELPPGFPGV
ncbi:MAG: hypothetical protein IPH07_00645 [Deltaproteobacteria bacterium]|nr:hypothetical protein [Deltaproteobacteria bacterium]